MHPPSNEPMRGVWNLFEHPDTSAAVFVVAIVSSVAMTLVAILLLGIEMLPYFGENQCLPNSTTPNRWEPFFAVETACTSWFMLELAVRVVAVHRRRSSGATSRTSSTFCLSYPTK